MTNTISIDRIPDFEKIVAGRLLKKPESFKTQALEDSKESCLERLKTDLEGRSLDDIHDSMSWWA
jgi:hypothetical protein